MAVDAIAQVRDPANGMDLTTTNYVVVVYYSARDGSNPSHSAQVTVNVPRGTGSVKANRLVREAVAADMLSQYSLTIDPSDIYFPQP